MNSQVRGDGGTQAGYSPGLCALGIARLVGEYGQGSVMLSRATVALRA